MKTIHVAAAVIVENHKIFAARRGYGEFKGYWEFPGGKIEKDETPETALRREIKEELEKVDWLPADRIAVEWVKGLKISR